MALIDSISIGDPLSSRMRRFLSASANVVFVQGCSSIKDVVSCLQNYIARDFFINNLNEELSVHLSDEISCLKELDEWSKPNKDGATEKVGTKETTSRFSGMIHISDVSFRYVENIYDAFKYGDFVRAKVISDKNNVFHLSTKEDNLGVVYAYCSLCGGILVPNQSRLRCKECGHLEGRKQAADYGLCTL